MKLSEIKKTLKTVTSVNFLLPDGNQIPSHFHITEVGHVYKKFIDCGGTVRENSLISLQLWNASDLEHRLDPQKLINIIELSEKVLGIEDLEIEVEYQSNTIGRYNLGFDGQNFLLLTKQTTCLAQDNCGTTKNNTASFTELNSIKGSSCSMTGGCC